MKLRVLMMMFVLIALPVGTLVPTAHALAQDTRAELKVRFEMRFAKISNLKDQDKVGETWQGFLEPVKGESDLSVDARKLVDEENADRRKLYDLIADDVVKGEKKLSPAKVGERNATRNFANAKPNEFLKSKDGDWFQRSEVTALKKKGKVGETSQGYLEAVKGGDLDQHEKIVLEEENRIRKEIYERQAHKNHSTAQEEASKAGQDNMEKARPGEFVKNKDGKWEKKA